MDFLRLSGLGYGKLFRQVEWSEDGKDVSGGCVIADVEKVRMFSNCFKITEKAAAEDDSNQMFPSISIANKMCLHDGTSLPAPGSSDVQPGDILEIYQEEETFRDCFFR